MIWVGETRVEMGILSRADLVEREEEADGVEG